METNSESEFVQGLADDVIRLVRPVMENRQDARQRPDVVELEQEYRSQPEALHNSQLPNLAINHERPEHRLMLLLKLKGMTNNEIAEQCQYSVAWVSQITRQPWFKNRLTKMLQEASDEIFDDLVKVETKNSFVKLLNLRDSAKSEQVQLASAVEILNRGLGKPVQRTENTTNVFHVTTKLEDIDAKLRQIEEEERRLLGQGITIGPAQSGEDRFRI